MRLGFVTALTNDFDARETIQKLAQNEIGVELEFEQAPTILNTPAALKKIFSTGVDACIIFVQSSSEEKPSLALAQEKIVDVEKEAGKYCIVCTVLDEEDQLDTLVEERLKEALNLLLGVRPEKQQSTETDLGIFSSPQSPSPDYLSPSNPDAGQAGYTTGSSGKSLF